MQKNFSHFYNILGYKWLQKCENFVFFPPVAAFRIWILINFAKPFRGNGMVFIVETRRTTSLHKTKIIPLTIKI